MKLFWKLFCSMTLITTLLFSIGGFTLIYGSFIAAVQSETQAALGENNLLAHALANGVQERSRSDAFSANPPQLLAHLTPVASTLTLLPFRLSTKEEVLFSNRWSGSNTPIIPTNSTRISTLSLQEQGYLIQVSSPIALGDTLVYVESFRPANRLFTDRQQQIQLCQLLLGGLLLVGGILIFVLSLGLTRPLTRLSHCVRGFAGGDFSARIQQLDQSETGMLAGDFNAMADKLADIMEQLNDTVQRQERFMGSFAHELKTPLTSIIGYADLLRSKNLSPANSALCATTIFSEGKRLEALSMKLMELLVLKKQDFPLQKIPAHQLFETVTRAVFPMLKKANIHFSARYDKCPIRCEPDLLETLCLNLIDNARKAATAKDGRIIFKGTHTQNGYLLQVQDNGAGMEEAELAKITEAFYMADKSRARAQGGAGLGLSICKEIAAIHGSSLRFESAPQKGTRVTLLLPVEGADV